jgi:hypothetical protein
MKLQYFILLLVAIFAFIGGRFYSKDSPPESHANVVRSVPAVGTPETAVDFDFAGSSLVTPVVARLENLLAETNAWKQISGITSMAEGWSSGELKAAAEYLTEYRKEPNAERLLSVVLIRWNAVDPQAALLQTLELHDLRENNAMRLVLEQLTDWAREDFDGVWQYAGELKGQPELAGRLRYAALSTLAESDPGAALDLYLSLDNADRMEGVIGSIAVELAKVDLPRAKALLTDASKRDQEAIVSGIMRFYAESDPAAGIAYFAELPAGLAKPHPMAYTLLSPWMRRAPQEAIAAIQAQLVGDRQRQSLSIAMSLWSQQDMDGVIDWLLPRLEDPAMVQAWQSLSYTLVRSDPIRGIELIRAHPELDGVQSPYFSAWVQDDVDAALDWALANLESAELSDTLSQSVHSIAYSDPVAATRIVDLMPMSDSRDGALATVARRLANQDVDLAMEWVLQQPEDAAQRNALSGVMSVWTEQAPEAAAQYLQYQFQTENELLRQQMVRQVAGTWAEKDPIAALDWVDGLDNQSLSEAAMGNILFEWSRNDLSAASAYVAKLDSKEKRSEHYSRLVLSAVQEDPAKAIKWVDSLPSEDRSDAVYRNLYSHWLQRDSVAASEWVNALPEGHERDLAAAQIVSEIDNKSPTEALPWALEIGDEKMRDRALGYVIRGASRLDLDVLRQSIEAISNEQTKERYRKQYLSE